MIALSKDARGRYDSTETHGRLEECRCWVRIRESLPATEVVEEDWLSECVWLGEEG